MRTLKKGEVVVVKFGPLRGTECCVVRVSKRTGTLTVTLLAAVGAYSMGEEVHLASYDVTRKLEVQP